jgi:prevent-host-death family protein
MVWYIQMEKIAVSKFKATCLAVLERVRRTGKPVLVTRFGRPLAQVVPAASELRRRKLGTQRGKVRIVGDIISPAVDEKEWEALRD